MGEIILRVQTVQGVPNGDAVEDNCGTCDNDPENDCPQDCAGVFGGDCSRMMSVEHVTTILLMTAYKTVRVLGVETRC